MEEKFKNKLENIIKLHGIEGFSFREDLLSLCEEEEDASERTAETTAETIAEMKQKGQPLFHLYNLVSSPQFRPAPTVAIVPFPLHDSSSFPLHCKGNASTL